MSSLAGSLSLLIGGVAALELISDSEANLISVDVPDEPPRWWWWPFCAGAEKEDPWDWVRDIGGEMERRERMWSRRA